MLNWKQNDVNHDESYSAFINLNVDLSEFAIPPVNCVGNYHEAGKRSAFSHFISFYLTKFPEKVLIFEGEWMLSFNYNHFYVNSLEEGKEMAENILKKLKEKLMEQL